MKTTRVERNRSLTLVLTCLLAVFASAAGEASPTPAGPGEQEQAPTAPEAAPASRKFTVPAGTRLLVRMVDSMDSRRNKVGDHFRATLEHALVVDGWPIAPKHTEVYGRLVEAREAGHIAGRSELRLELSGILINGQTQPLVTGPYEVSGKSRGRKSAKRIGGGAALGGLIGAIAGGGKGAAIGAGSGAAAGTVIEVLTRGEQVHVPSETVLEFTLAESATLPISAPAAR